MAGHTLLPAGDYRTTYAADTTVFPTTMSRNAMIVGIIAICFAPYVLNEYALSLLIQIGIFGIAALGLNIVVGFTGQISIGHAAFFGFGAFTSAYLNNRFGIPVFFCIPLAGVVTAAVGLIFGLPAARLKGLYLAIATLAAQYILLDFFARAEWFTGGSVPASAEPFSIFGYSMRGDKKYFYVVLAYVVVCYLLVTNLIRSRDGRALIHSMEGLGVLLKSADTAELERAMTALFDRFGGMGVAELRTVDPRELQSFAREFGETIRALPFQLPESFLLLVRTISLVSGVTSALNRDFNMWDEVEPFARTVLSGNSGAGVLRGFGKQAVSYASNLARLPGRIDELASRLERGQVAVRNPDLERRLTTLERAASRVASALVFAGLLIAGVLVLPTNEVLGWVFVGVSALPLLHVLIRLRGR